MTSRRAVWLVAALAVLGRFCGLLWPLRPDEAGFLIVARTWSPEADSVFGAHFVDRPPLLIAVFKASDMVGGPTALRVLAAVGCGVAVLMAAEFVRELARTSPHRFATPPLALVTFGTAAITASFLVTAQIDAIAAKGELLGVPVLLASCLLSLRALRLHLVGSTRGGGWNTARLNAFGAGLLAMTAVGLKQSLVGALVFGGVLLLAAAASKALRGRAWWGLAGAAVAGASLPVAATIIWSLGAGVSLEALWYTVVSFRGEASAVVAQTPGAAAVGRSIELAVIAAATGLALMMVWCLARIVPAVRRLPAPTTAVVAMLVVDCAVVGLSGSFWTPYLFALIPPVVMLWACVRVSELPFDSHGPTARLRAEGRWHPRREVLLVAFCVVSAVISLLAWTLGVWRNGTPPLQHVTGAAIGEAALPGEELVVHGGRADIQWASGLASPYEHLWSLPMRTMDPDREQLRLLLESPEAPEWFVLAASLDAWDGASRTALEPVLRERYAEVPGACGGLMVLRRVDAPPVASLATDCTTPWGQR